MTVLPNGIVIVCDGGCLNNQTPELRQAYGSIAVFVNNVRKQMHYTGQDGKQHETWQARIEWGNVTNNQAEFQTLLVALGYIQELFGRSKPAPITLMTDSELVVNSALGLNKKFKVEHIRSLAAEVRAWLVVFPTVTIQHIPNEQVKAILGH